MGRRGSRLRGRVMNRGRGDGLSLGSVIEVEAGELVAEGWGVSRGLLFFQAEDGIRDWSVTGVQTCALPILLKDIAVLTGGQLIAEELGLKLENVTLADLGRAKRVTIDKDNTTIIGGEGKKDLIKGRIAEIRTQIENTTSDYDKEKLQERLAKPVRRVAVVKGCA